MLASRGPASAARNPPFFLVNSRPPRISPERSRARSGLQNLDGEDRSGIIRGEGKG